MLCKLETSFSLLALNEKDVPFLVGIPFLYTSVCTIPLKNTRYCNHSNSRGANLIHADNRLDFRRLPGPVLILPEERPSGGWVRAHFSEQRLVIEPTQISYWRFFYIIFVGKLLTNTIPTSLQGTSFLIIPHITKTESNNYFIIYCFDENKDKHSSIAWNTVWRSFWNSCIV